MTKGETLSSYRSKSRLSQKELATKCKMNREAISRAERDVPVTKQTMWKLINYFKEHHGLTNNEIEILINYK